MKAEITLRIRSGNVGRSQSKSGVMSQPSNIRIGDTIQPRTTGRLGQTKIAISGTGCRDDSAMKRGRELAVIIGTRVTATEAAEWAEYVRQNEARSSCLLREVIRRELAQRNFANVTGREQAAARQVLELFAETMAMSLEGPDLARFMEIVERIAPDSDFVRRAGLEAPDA
jgi:hypothetical protein